MQTNPVATALPDRMRHTPRRERQRLLGRTMAVAATVALLVRPPWVGRGPGSGMTVGHPAADRPGYDGRARALRRYGARSRRGGDFPLVSSGVFQPAVTVVDDRPATKLLASLSMPRGSPWCQDMPTMWFVGHQSDGERPWCRLPSGDWARLGPAQLDTIDALNADVGDRRIDRHGCAHLDINRDGVEDIVCTVGAEKGHGIGYNEVYLTMKDGGLYKVLDDELGVAKYPTMRNRLALALRGPEDAQLLFVGVKGATPREDGAYNRHIMFRNDYDRDHPERRPWFREVQASDGPWKVASDVECAAAADITGNGVDDLVLCQSPLPPAIFLQAADGDWRERRLPEPAGTASWRSVRVADVTSDGRPDLVAVDQGWDGSKLWVFKGQSEAPYFDFLHPWYTYELPFAAPDVEVLDVNSDGVADIYVVQSNERYGYCSYESPNYLWGDQVQPDADWIPPLDSGEDVLFLGNVNATSRASRFNMSRMEFKKHGCGNMAVRFGSGQKLILGNGNMGHPGYHMFLEWGTS